MFPFWGPLRNVSAKNAYSQHDIQNIQKWATQNELMVIPLVQTFGHLEFILKLDEFKDLREVPMYPQSICPSQDKSWEVIKEVIDQVNKITFKLEKYKIFFYFVKNIHKSKRVRMNSRLCVDMNENVLHIPIQAQKKENFLSIFFFARC